MKQGKEKKNLTGETSNQRPFIKESQIRFSFRQVILRTFGNQLMT